MNADAPEPPLDAAEIARLLIELGRRDEADISIPWDPEMSRLHAELELRAGEIEPDEGTVARAKTPCSLAGSGHRSPASVSIA